MVRGPRKYPPPPVADVAAAPLWESIAPCCVGVTRCVQFMLYSLQSVVPETQKNAKEGDSFTQNTAVQTEGGPLREGGFIAALGPDAKRRGPKAAIKTPPFRRGGLFSRPTWLRGVFIAATLYSKSSGKQKRNASPILGTRVT